MLKCFHVIKKLFETGTIPRVNMYSCTIFGHVGGMMENNNTQYEW